MGGIVDRENSRRNSFRITANKAWFVLNQNETLLNDMFSQYLNGLLWSYMAFYDLTLCGLLWFYMTFYGPFIVFFGYSWQNIDLIGLLSSFLAVIDHLILFSDTWMQIFK